MVIEAFGCGGCDGGEGGGNVLQAMTMKKHTIKGLQVTSRMGLYLLRRRGELTSNRSQHTFTNSLSSMVMLFGPALAVSTVLFYYTIKLELLLGVCLILFFFFFEVFECFDILLSCI